MLLKYRHFVREHSSMLNFLGSFLFIMLIIFIVGNFTSFVM
jgi:hypothetical protein